MCLSPGTCGFERGWDETVKNDVAHTFSIYAAFHRGSFCSQRPKLGRIRYILLYEHVCSYVNTYVLGIKYNNILWYDLPPPCHPELCVSYVLERPKYDKTHICLSCVHVRRRPIYRYYFVLWTTVCFSL